MTVKKILQLVGISFMMALSMVFGRSLNSDEYLDRLLTKKISACA